MLHTWNCNKCNKKYETSCFEFLFRDGKMINAWEDTLHRKYRDSNLCSACFKELENNPDPVFELLFRLKEKERELALVTKELELLFENRIKEKKIT